MLTYDVIIIGAGIVGTTLARELSRYRLRILLLEKDYDVSMGATKANSAIVHGGYAEKHSTLKGHLCYEGRREFRRLNEELKFGFDEKGSLVVSMDDDPEPLEQLRQNGIRNGLDDLHLLKGDEIQAREPNLNPGVRWGLYCAGAGVCSPYEMAIAMAENAIYNGAELRLQHEVRDISYSDGRFFVTAAQETFVGRRLINAAGLFADAIAQLLKVNTFTIRPRSGEYLIFARGTGDAIRHVIFQLPTAYGKGVLLTSTYHGNLLLGPDASDTGGRDDTSTHLERMAAIYAQTKRLYGGIDPKKFLRSFTGIRARADNDDFIIEESAIPGFIQVAGIQSPGLTASPAIARRVMGLLQQSGLKLQQKPDFDPHRRPIITREPLRPFPEIKDRIDIPSAPDKIICRCEQVTEAVIVDALHREVPVLGVDGVKRRTRAGMGWCQGTFCRPRVVEVMEREYGQSIDPRFDIEHSGVNRVQKSELLDFLQSQSSDQPV